MAERYVAQLVAEGVPKEEATRRHQRMAVIRRESSAREMVYWNAAFKLGGRRSVAELAALWKDFQILRVEDLDPGMEMNDWAPSRTMPTARIVARKH